MIADWSTFFSGSARNNWGRIQISGQGSGLQYCNSLENWGLGGQSFTIYFAEYPLGDPLYILDPKDVYGPDFLGETYRVLKEKNERKYGEYRNKPLGTQCKLYHFNTMLMVSPVGEEKNTELP